MTLKNAKDDGPAGKQPKMTSFFKRTPGSSSKEEPQQTNLKSFFKSKSAPSEPTAVEEKVVLSSVQKNKRRMMIVHDDPSDDARETQVIQKQKKIKPASTSTRMIIDDDDDDDEEKQDMEQKIVKYSEDKQAMKKTDENLGQMSTSKTSSGPLLYLKLAETFDAIERTSSRLEIQQILTDFFIQAIQETPGDLLPAIYLAVCTQLAPPYEGVQIGIGDSILIKAIGQTTGKEVKVLKKLYQTEGDLGLVAEKSRSRQRTLGFTTPRPLTVQRVYDSFLHIAKTSGNKSQDKKVSVIQRLLVSCQNVETRFVIRGLQGKLRIGLAEKSIGIALAHAFAALDPRGNRRDAEEQKEFKLKAVKLIKRAFSECPSYDVMIPVLLEFGLEKLMEHCQLKPGVPVSPMLARPTKSYNVVFERFANQPFTCEYKYDGERAQIHIQNHGKDIQIFSRNFENSTERFPDVVKDIREAMKVQHMLESAIIDTEVVAFDVAQQVRLPFQVLSTRSRKNVKLSEIKVPVCIYAFDLLYLNGESYLKETLTTRRKVLRESFEILPHRFEYATSFDVDVSQEEQDDNVSAEDQMEKRVEIIRTFLQEAVTANCEGLMVKTLANKEATYEPANRSHKWLKLKKDYLEGIGDSVDLVPIGAFYGKGKRTGVYGAYVLACYDPDSDMLQMITKLGTGLSDDMLDKFYHQFKDLATDRPLAQYQRSTDLTPDVWFQSHGHVWEILGADLSISPRYTAAMGLVAKDKGISLRFPRFIRERQDKQVEHATSSQEIADLYQAQDLASATIPEEDDDDEEDAL